MFLARSEGQGQGQVRYGQEMEILDECRATHVLWVLWDIELDGLRLFYLTRGKVKARSNEVRFENSKFSFKSIPLLSNSVSGFQKYNLSLRTIINAKIAF